MSGTRRISRRVNTLDRMFQIIPPRFTLPMRTDVPPVIVLQQPVQQIVPYECHTVAEYLERETPVYVNPPTMPRRKRSLLQWVVFYCKELAYSAMAIESIWLACLYFDNPVWKVVTFVVTIILWSNFASSAARNRTPQAQAIEMIDTMSTQAIRIVNWSRKQYTEPLPVVGSDTSFLIALKQRWIED